MFNAMFLALPLYYLYLYFSNIPFPKVKTKVKIKQLYPTILRGLLFESSSHPLPHPPL
jgi:hypothetical protein